MKGEKSDRPSFLPTWRYCSRCGEKFKRHSKHGVICLKCINNSKSHKSSQDFSKIHQTRARNKLLIKNIRARFFEAEQ
jgi:hypothetical protein